MSKVFVTRQPIFDRDMITYGYELVYQHGLRTTEDLSDDQANATLLDSLLYEEFDDFVDNTRGFINFSEKLLIDQIPQMLPKESLIVQIMDSVPVTDALIEACKTLKESGYTLALHNFWLGEQERIYEPIMQYIDMIKVPFSRETTQEQMQLLRKFRNKVMMVADNVQSLSDHQSAVRMGYHLFQGFFFKESVVTDANEIGSLSNNLVMIASELGKPEPNYKKIAQIFESDVDLSYKLLRMANSVYFGASREITSIRQALVHIGTQELLRWSHLMLIKGVQNAKNAELVKASLVRGKLLGLLAHKLSRPQYESDYFIAGLFSSINVLLGEDMEDVVESLPLNDQVKDALIGRSNELRTWLDAILDFEKTDWDALDALIETEKLKKKEFMSLYMKALKWCLETNNMLAAETV